MPSSHHLTNLSSHEHIMLLYGSDEERNNAAIDYINKGLKSGYYCIYASIYANDNNSSSAISIYPIKLIIIRKILKVVNYKLLILNLIISQHLTSIYVLLKR